MSKFEDPEVLKERQEAVQHKSVSELSQISSLSDIPLPSRIEKLLPASQQTQRRLKRSRSGEAISKPKDYTHLSPMAIHDTIYSTLPRSMKSELKVRTKQYDNPDDLRDRKELVGRKSPAELAEMKGLTDLPIPSPIQNFWQGVKNTRLEVPDFENLNFDNISQCTG